MSLKKPSTPAYNIKYKSGKDKKVVKNTGVIKEKGYYKGYDRGILLSKIKSSDISLQYARDLFRKNKSFNKDEKIYINYLNKGYELSKVKKSSYDVKTHFSKDAQISPQYCKSYVTKGKEKVKLFQYVVESYVNGKVIAGRSKLFGRQDARTTENMRQEAFNNFHIIVSARLNHNNYENSKDGDRIEGENIVASNMSLRRNLREGYVYYRF